jgi:hypothetical protein
MRCADEGTPVPAERQRARAGLRPGHMDNPAAASHRGPHRRGRILADARSRLGASRQAKGALRVDEPGHALLGPAALLAQRAARSHVRTAHAAADQGQYHPKPETWVEDDRGGRGGGASRYRAGRYRSGSSRTAARPPGSRLPPRSLARSGSERERSGDPPEQPAAAHHAVRTSGRRGARWAGAGGMATVAGGASASLRHAGACRHRRAAAYRAGAARGRDRGGEPRRRAGPGGAGGAGGRLVRRDGPVRGRRPGGAGPDPGRVPAPRRGPVRRAGGAPRPPRRGPCSRSSRSTAGGTRWSWTCRTRTGL